MDSKYQALDTENTAIIGAAKPNGANDSHGGTILEDEAEMVCRICLEEDEPETMIAPCRCKGSSKWVHRSCLDLWRTNQRNRAFSQCTECLFEYHLQPPQRDSASRRRRFKFYWSVSRDLCGITLLLQLVVCGLGALVHLMDVNRDILGFFCVLPDCRSGNNWHAKGIYYMCGFLVLLVILGCFGSAILCANKCSIQESIPFYQSDEQSEQQQQSNTEARHAYTSRAPSESERVMYRHHRRRQNRRNHGDCCDGCVYYNYPFYMPTDGGGDCFCCCCCDQNDNSDCSCPTTGGGGNNGGGGDSMHVFLIILAGIAVIMAIIGFVVGIVIAVIISQRVVQSHVHMVQTRQLVKKFTVMDLAGYDMDKPLPSAPVQEEYIDQLEQQAQHPAPSAPPLDEEDEIYLQKLGLMK